MFFAAHSHSVTADNNCKTANRLAVYVVYLLDTRPNGAIDLADTQHIHIPLTFEQFFS